VIRLLTHDAYPCAKGKAAVKALLTPAFKKVKNAPKVETEEEAVALLLKVLPQ
jgi:translocation protein SEC62